MILDDAIVERAAVDARESPLLAVCGAGPTTVAIVVRAALSDPHLRRSYPRAEAVVLALLELDAAGVLQVSPCAIGGALAAYYETGRTGGDRSLAYVATYQRNWHEHRGLYDFVEAGDANSARKALQRDSYLNHLGPHLDRLRTGEAVLDAGCGVGRLTGSLLGRGLRVTCADASAEALKCAVRVGLRRGATGDSLDARLCDVRDLSCFDDRSFAATIALEVICYQEDPSVALDELVRVTAPGGLIALSVEGLYGSLIADEKLGPTAQRKVLDTAAIDIDDQLSVRYFTKGGLRALLESAGLEAIDVVGTQYTADGVFDRLVTEAVLASEEQLRNIIALERKAATDPVLEPLARAWLATARVPGASR